MKRSKRFDYIATAGDWRGRETGRWAARTVKGAMALADTHAHPNNRVSVNAAYTSDGTFWGEGRGRVMAQRRDGHWLVESYRDKPTETVMDHGEPWSGKARRGETRSRRDKSTSRYSYGGVRLCPCPEEARGEARGPTMLTFDPEDAYFVRDERRRGRGRSDPKREAILTRYRVGFYDKEDIFHSVYVFAKDKDDAILAAERKMLKAGERIRGVPRVEED